MFRPGDAAAMHGKLTAQPVITHSSTALLAKAASRSRNRLRGSKRVTVFTTGAPVRGMTERTVARETVKCTNLHINLGIYFFSRKRGVNEEKTDGAPRPARGAPAFPAGA